MKEYNVDQIYAIMEGTSDGIRKIKNIVFVDKNEVIKEFVEKLDKLWEEDACSYCAFEDNIMVLMNEYKEKLK